MDQSSLHWEVMRNNTIESSWYDKQGTTLEVVHIPLESRYSLGITYKIVRRTPQHHTSFETSDKPHNRKGTRCSYNLGTYSISPINKI